MKDLFLVLRERLRLKEPLVLVTVTESSGSVPRGTGARMLVGKGPGDNIIRLCGSIGGGLPEHLVIEEAGRLLHKAGYSPAVSIKKYLLHSTEAAALGLVCGGEITVFSRSMDTNEPGLLELIEKGVACIENGTNAFFVMETSENIYPALGLTGEEGFFAGQSSYQKPFSEPLFSDGFVYIFGGGHIAQELVPLLARLDFRCVVFDDREEFVSKAIFPQAEKLILGDFERIGNHISLTSKDYAVIISRGHQWDLEAWAFALESPAAYIGVIGSKTKHEFVKAKLQKRGFESATINAARVHAPIGINIKSQTPAEIAVSIAAELILTRREK